MNPENINQNDPDLVLFDPGRLLQHENVVTWKLFLWLSDWVGRACFSGSFVAP